MAADNKRDHFCYFDMSEGRSQYGLSLRSPSRARILRGETDGESGTRRQFPVTQIVLVTADGHRVWGRWALRVDGLVVNSRPSLSGGPGLTSTVVCLRTRYSGKRAEALAAGAWFGKPGEFKCRQGRWSFSIQVLREMVDMIAGYRIYGRRNGRCYRDACRQGNQRKLEGRLMPCGGRIGGRLGRRDAGRLRIMFATAQQEPRAAKR